MTFCQIIAEEQRSVIFFVESDIKRFGVKTEGLIKFCKHAIDIDICIAANSFIRSLGKLCCPDCNRRFACFFNECVINIITDFGNTASA